MVAFEVACNWDRLGGREEYETLVADLAKYRDYRVTVVPMVIGVLGTITNLRRHLGRAEIWNRNQIEKTMGDMQRETLCAAVQIIQRHMTVDTLSQT